jgi:hypothetical protein
MPSVQAIRAIKYSNMLGLRADMNDVISVAKTCARLSGLESGEIRLPDVDPRGFKILYWQRQQCTCQQLNIGSSSNNHKYCTSDSCVPFICLIQEDWQREFLKEIEGESQMCGLDGTFNLNHYQFYLYCFIFVSKVCMNSFCYYILAS